MLAHQRASRLSARGLAKIAAVQPKSAGDIPHLRVGHVLTRSPILTREPSPFEYAYYNYQNRLRKALSNPFPFEFYFKPGSLTSGRFKVEEQKRENWLLGRKRTTEQRWEEKRQDETDADLMQERYVAEPRVTDADFHKNPRSLNRLGSRTLYLLLRELDQTTYTFPESRVPQGHFLHQASRLTYFLI
jgi:large subunit ribosomal protein L46